MQIKFNIPKTRVMFIHENALEYKSLARFPAFLTEGPHFFVPAKISIVYNVVSRLQASFKKIKVDKEVMDFMNQEMKLLPLPEDFKFHTKPMIFQEIALRYLYTMGSAGLLLDPGMGKSKVVLDYIKLKGFKRTLLVCPLPLLFVWEDEVFTHRPDLTIHLVKTTDWESEWEQAKDKDIICMNYTKAVIFKDQIRKQQFDFVHLDEFLIKDPSSLRTQGITQIAKHIPYRCGGSGTLINNSILDVFSPVRFIEPSLVGWSYTNFLNKHTIRNPHQLRMIVGTKGNDEARSILDSCCIVMSKDEWLKLPNKTFHDIYVQPGETQREFYYNLQRNFIATIQGETVEIDNALVMMSKLYQVSNGFVYVSDKKESEAEVIELLAEETTTKKKKSTRRTVFFPEQPKIKALIKLIKETTKEKRAIIWFNMGAEYTLIKQMMDDNGWSYLTIKGGTKELGKIVREYNNNPNIQFLICQAKSVNYGVTVLGTTKDKMDDSDIEFMPGVSPSVFTQIFYSCNYSLEVYLQQQDRIHRIGQIHECTYYRLWLNTSVEIAIKAALENKMYIRKDMLIDIAEKLKEAPSYLV
jgi:SNF2 family DNA or RNA helicase